MNLFSNMDNQGDLFSDLTPVAGPASPLPPETSARTGRLAAIASIDPGHDDLSLLQLLEQNTKSYQDLIEKTGDDTVRMEIAGKQQHERMQGYIDLVKTAQTTDPSGELLQGSMLAAKLNLQEDIEKRKQYALEQEAVKRIQDVAARGDNTQAKLLLNNLENEDTLHVMTDIQTKYMILQREIEKAQVAKEDQGWFFDAVDFLFGWGPLIRSGGNTGNVDIQQGLKHFYDNLASGQRQQHESDSLWNMSLVDFAPYVKDHLIPNVHDNTTHLGYTNKTQELEILSKMRNTPSPLVQNIGDGIDNLGLIIGAAKAGKAAASLPVAMVRMGARKEASQVIAQAAREMAGNGVTDAAKRTGVSASEVIENLSVSAVNPNASALRVPLAAEADLALQTGDAIMAELPKMLESSRLTPEELKTAIDAAISRTASSLNREVKDVVATPKSITVSTGQQVHYVEMVVGKEGGGGYADARYAKTNAKSRGFHDAEVFRDESGQWFYKINAPVTETAFYADPVKLEATGWFQKMLNGGHKVLNQRIVSDERLSDAALVAGNKRQAFFGNIIKKMSDDVSGSLNNTQRYRVSQILGAGKTEQKWFTDEEFDIIYRRGFGEAPSQAEIKANRAAKDINDLEYTLRNDERWTERYVKGFNSVSFTAKKKFVDRENGIVDRNLTDKPKYRAYNVHDDVHYTEEIPDKEWKRLKDEGYVLINTERPMELVDGTRVKSFLVKGQDLTVEQLRRDQIPYKAGGHRFYEGKYFVKQTRWGVQPDTGKRYLLNPDVYMVGSKAEAQFYAQTMEAARKAVENGLGAEYLDKNVFKGHAGFDTGEEFIQHLKDGVYDKDTSFLHYRDREMPDEYQLRDSNMDYVDLEEGSFNGFLRTQGRMYYGGKGEQLKDYQGSLAKTLDPYKAINQSLMNIANVAGFADYKMEAMERWVATFRPYLGDGLPQDASAYHIFNNGKFNAPNVRGAERIRQEMETQRDIIKRNLGWKTEGDLRKEQMTRQISEWVYGNDPNNEFRSAAGRKVDWWLDQNPISKLRGMAFDMKLGIWNPVQFPVQLSTAWSAAWLGGGDGFKALGYVLPLRSYLTKGGNEALLDHWVGKGVAKWMDMEPEEFKESMRVAKRSGFFDLKRGTHVMVGDYGPQAAIGDFGHKVDEFRQNGRFFFNEAEIWNRATAWGIAWKEVRKANPELAINGPEFYRKLQGRAEDYSMSMSEQSKAWWQQGFLSIPTQFWAYNVRMMEAMLGDKFTPVQRMRLALSQVILAGSAGLPAASLIGDMHRAKTGEDMKPDTFWGAVDRGLLDTLAYNYAGVDAQFGKRFGTGAWSTDLIKDIFGWSQYGQRSADELIGGATYSIFKDMGGTLKDIVKWTVAESGGDTGRPIAEHDVLKLAEQISLVSYAYKGYMVAKYGEFISNNGTVTSANLPKQQAFAAALGFQPGQQYDISAMMAHQKNKSAAVKDLQKQIQNYRSRMVNEPANREQYEQQINLLIKLSPPDVARAAFKKAHSSTQPSLYESLKRQMERDKVNGETDG